MLSKKLEIKETIINMINEISNVDDFDKIALKPKLDDDNFMKSFNSINSKKERENYITARDIQTLFKRDIFRFRIWVHDNLKNLNILLDSLLNVSSENLAIQRVKSKISGSD